MIEKKQKKTYYIERIIQEDKKSGEVLSWQEKKVVKASIEPNFIKVYYETMMAFNQIHDIPTSFVLSLSKFISWSNDDNPQIITLNKMAKETAAKDCAVSLPQIDRYIRRAIKNGLLFKTKYRAVYEVNPFMIAKGKWENIQKLRANYDFNSGKWERTAEIRKSNETNDTQLDKEAS